jgi:hypothetical protein
VREENAVQTGRGEGMEMERSARVVTDEWWEQGHPMLALPWPGARPQTEGGPRPCGSRGTPFPYRFGELHGRNLLQGYPQDVAGPSSVTLPISRSGSPEHVF